MKYKADFDYNLDGTSDFPIQLLCPWRTSNGKNFLRLAGLGGLVKLFDD